MLLLEITELQGVSMFPVLPGVYYKYKSQNQNRDTTSEEV